MAGKSDIVEQALKLVMGAGEKAASTIRAYHGSPHDFPPVRLIEMSDGTRLYQNMLENPDTPEGAKILEEFPLGRFDMSKIGTGEGAQMYGHGLYFAENEGVAKGYRDALTNKNVPQGKHIEKVAFNIVRNAPNRTDAELAPFVRNVYPDATDAEVSDALKVARANQQIGRMYEVEINADPNTFLDWDKPLSEQPEILKQFGYHEAMYPEDWIPDLNMKGSELYRMYAGSTNSGARGESISKMTNRLASGDPRTIKMKDGTHKDVPLRIPGIKYLDAGSRVPSAMAKKELADWQAQLSVAERELADATARGDNWLISRKQAEVKRVQDGIARVSKEAEGTRNFVVFDDSLISIIRKYGIAGASAMLGYNLLENLSPEQAKAATEADNHYKSSGTHTGGMLPPGMEPSGELTSRVPSASERIYDYVLSKIGGEEDTKPQRAETIMNLIDQTPLGLATVAYDIGRAGAEAFAYANGGSVRKGYQTKGRVIGSAIEEAIRIAREGLEGLASAKGKTPRELAEAYGSSLPNVPFEEWRYEFTPTTELLPRKEFDLNAVNPGDVFIPFIGDRTSAGRRIMSINDQPLAIFGNTEGGPDYARGLAQQKDSSIWASEKGAVSRLNKRIENALNASREKGYKDPQAYGLTVAMSPQSGDFAAHVAETYMGMIPGAKISKKAAKEFDAQMRQKYPDWPGILSDKAANYVINADAGAHRVGVLSELDKAKWAKMGFPDVSLARYATTAPDLIDVPTEATGYMVGRIDPSLAPQNITVPHRTYNTTIPGEYVGGLPAGLMRDDVFTQFSRAYDESPADPSRYVNAKRRSFEKNPTAFQVMEGRDIEDLIRKVTALKGEYADGGAVDDDEDIFDALRLAGETVSTGINRYVNPIRRMLGVETGELPEGVEEVNYGDLYRQARDADYSDLYRRAMEAIDNAALYLGGVDPSAKRPMKNPVSPSGKIVDRVPQEHPDVEDALRIAKADGGSGTGSVFMTDANGIQYDAQGNVISNNGQKAPEQNVNNPPPEQKMTPEEVGRRAAEDPATFDYMMRNYAVPDTDIARYENMVKEVGKQPQEVQQMTHTGAAPTREMKVDMPLLGGEKSIGSAPYNVAGPMQGTAQAIYDFKTVPFYFFPPTAGPAMAADVVEGVATGDPLQAGIAIATGPGGKMAKAVGVGLTSYAMDPAQAQAGPSRWYSKLFEVANALPMEKMTGEQALAMLRKAAPLEEIRWTGTDKFLSQNPQVSKQALLDYIQKNRVQPKEITLGGGDKPTRLQDILPSQIPEPILAKYRGAMDEAMKEKVGYLTQMKSLVDADGNISLDNYAPYMSLKKKAEVAGEKLDRISLDMRQEYVDSIGGLGRPTIYGPGSRYGDRFYTPGGKNYQETTFNIPPQKVELVEWPVIDAFGNVKARYDSKEAAERIARTSGSTVGEPRTTIVEKGYRSSHWPELNTLGHIRTQILEAELPGSNRPLKLFNVDEAQSDYAQDVRKYGLREGNGENVTKKLNEFTQRMADRWVTQRAEQLYQGSPELFSGIEEARNGAMRLANQRGATAIAEELGMSDEFESLVAAEQRYRKGLDPAPYVTNTQHFTDFSIKKALDQAIDSGADYFTFTPGEVHADRYNLARDLAKIEYEPDDHGVYSISAIGKNGENVLEKDMDIDEIEEYFGKEIAKKIKADEGRKIEDRPLRDWRVLENEQIKAKGDAMVDAYNNIYKRRVEKVVKDATGKKVTWEVLPAKTANGIVPRLGFRIDEDVKKARFSDFKKGGRVTAGNAYDNTKTVDRALALTKEF